MNRAQRVALLQRAVGYRFEIEICLRHESVARSSACVGPCLICGSPIKPGEPSRASIFYFRKGRAIHSKCAKLARSVIAWGSGFLESDLALLSPLVEGRAADARSTARCLILRFEPAELRRLLQDAAKDLESVLARMPARAAALTPEQRREIARKGAQAMWAKKRAEKRAEKGK